MFLLLSRTAGRDRRRSFRCPFCSPQCRGMPLQILGPRRSRPRRPRVRRRNARRPPDAGISNADPANNGRVCDVGLWRYSAAPELLLRVPRLGGFLRSPRSVRRTAGSRSSARCSCSISSLKVTGIPLTEEYSLKSKGDAYREYQRTTSAFIPWFRKSMINLDSILEANVVPDPAHPPRHPPSPRGDAARKDLRRISKRQRAALLAHIAGLEAQPHRHRRRATPTSSTTKCRRASISSASAGG